MKNLIKFIVIMFCVVPFFSNAQGVDWEETYKPYQFLKKYSESLLYGTYQQHASCYWKNTFFGGQWLTKEQITEIARNFYANNITLEHDFKVLDYYRDAEYNLVVIVYEHHKIKNRYTNVITDGTVKKRFKLWFYKYYQCVSQEEIS